MKIVQDLSLGEHYEKLVSELEKAKQKNPTWESPI